jgi:hypothetical protein
MLCDKCSKVTSYNACVQSAMTKDTLTPPPSSPQELQDQVRGTGMQCDIPAASTYFEQTFQAIAQLALQNKFLELIRVAEQADLAVCLYRPRLGYAPRKSTRTVGIPMTRLVYSS